MSYTKEYLADRMAQKTRPDEVDLVHLFTNIESSPDKALSWAKNYSQNNHLLIWVSSPIIISIIQNQELGNFADLVRCVHLAELISDLSKLTSRLNMGVLHYAYTNKDCIPHFFL
jgi:hypothetical protein